MSMDEDAEQIWKYQSRKFNVCAVVSWCLYESPLGAPRVDSFYLEVMRIIEFHRYAGDEWDG